MAVRRRGGTMPNYLSRITILMIVASFFQAGCSDSPLPSQPSAPAESESGGAVGASAVPKAVFLTNPPASDGFVTGSLPLEVTFNLCQSRPTDESDDLKYT